jgi:protease-4
MDKSAVKAAAEGRLFSGTQARSLGLVDEHAGLAEALKRAREEGGVAEDAAVERWPPRKTFLDALAGRMGSGQAGLGGSELLLALDARAPATLASATAFAGILSRERVGVVLPYALWLD